MPSRPSPPAARIQRRTRVAAWTGGWALLVVAALAIWGGRQARLTGPLIRQSHQRIGRAEAIDVLLLTSQVNHRTFLLTGDQAALDSFRAAAAAADSVLDALRRDPTADARLAATLAKLADRIGRLTAFRERVVTARGLSTAAATDLLKGPDALAFREAAHGALESLIEAERAQLVAREDRQQAVIRLLTVAMMAALSVAGALYTWGLRALRRDAADMIASEGRYRVLSDQSPDGVLVHQNGIIRYANTTAVSMLGEITPEGLTGRRFLDIIHPSHQQAVTARMVTMDQRGEAVPARETTVIREDGSTMEVEAISAPIEFDEAPAYQVVVRDITERKRQEVALLRLSDQLRASESNYRILAENIGDLVSRRSPDGVFEYASPSHEAVLGWTPEELIGRSAFDLVHPDDAVRLRAGPMAESLRGQSPDLYRVRIRHKAGHYLWCEVVLRPILDDGGMVAGHVVTARDVTARLDLEEQLRNSQKMEALGRMASGVAHDFNNLLLIIRSTAELAEPELPGTAPNSGFAELARAVDRAAGLTTQLLAFSRQQHVAPAVLDVARVVREAEPILQRIAGPANAVTVGIDQSPGDTGLTIEADRGLLERAIMNLLVNSRDAMPHGGTVAIHCRAVTLARAKTHRHGVIPRGSFVAITVADTGIGIAETALDHVFEPFYSSKAETHSTGLGLATVYGVVQQAGGAITVESVPQRGTRFTIYWPLVAGAPGLASAPVASPPVTTKAAAPITAARAVLLVDDDDAVRTTVARVLARLGYHVHQASSGPEAIQWLTNNAASTDAIVTDVRMPGMNGVTMIATLRDLGIDLPVLFISGQLDTAIPVGWPDTVPRRFLGKPFAIGDLDTSLRGLFE